MTRALVTGGFGFLGTALVRRLLEEGQEVRVLDNAARGQPRRLADVAARLDLVVGDVRDLEVMRTACRGVDVIWHLAAVNGTENFYRQPQRVLDVGVRGMLNVIDAAIAERVPELFFASSSEVYASAPRVPTDERVPLTVPDPLNPRFSYSGSKIISELLLINTAREQLRRAVIFRPHNVYGPDMGWEHVIPQLTVQLHRLAPGGRSVRLPIQGNGQQTRSFVHIDDLVEGLMVLFRAGRHLEIYNVGTEDEVTIGALARDIGAALGLEVEVVPGRQASGATERRCPDITKIRALGYAPRVPLSTGLASTVRWYDAHADEAPPDSMKS